MKARPITVKDLIHHLESLKKPNAGLIYSCDDEGNNFCPVFYTPTLGKFIDGEFHIKNDTNWVEYQKLGGEEVICIN